MVWAADHGSTKTMCIRGHKHNEIQSCGPLPIFFCNSLHWGFDGFRQDYYFGWGFTVVQNQAFVCMFSEDQSAPFLLLVLFVVSRVFLQCLFLRCVFRGGERSNVQRCSKTIPLIREAISWSHGVYIGTTITSEEDGAVLSDPFVLSHSALCAAEDYLQRWIHELGWASPKVFFLNLFRADSTGRLLWPGFGENIRILQWIVHRIHGGQNAVKSMALLTLSDLGKTIWKSLVQTVNKKIVQRRGGCFFRI